MRIEYAQAIVGEAANFDSIEEVSLYEDYSGRGMNGKTTTGVVCSSVAYMLALVAAASRTLTQKEEEADSDSADDPHMDSEDFVFDMENLRTDSMGKDIIFY